MEYESPNCEPLADLELGGIEAGVPGIALAVLVAAIYVVAGISFWIAGGVQVALGYSVTVASQNSVVS